MNPHENPVEGRLALEELLQREGLAYEVKSPNTLKVELTKVLTSHPFDTLDIPSWKHPRTKLTLAKPPLWDAFVTFHETKVTLAVTLTAVDPEGRSEEAIREILRDTTEGDNDVSEHKLLPVTCSYQEGVGLTVRHTVMTPAVPELLLATLEGLPFGGIDALTKRFRPSGFFSAYYFMELIYEQP